MTISKKNVVINEYFLENQHSYTKLNENPLNATVSSININLNNLYQNKHMINKIQ